MFIIRREVLAATAGGTFTDDLAVLAPLTTGTAVGGGNFKGRLRGKSFGINKYDKYSKYYQRRIRG